MCNTAHNTTEADSPDGLFRTLGKEGLTIEAAKDHDSYETYEIPVDILTASKTFTPQRYAKICRDIAYFTNQVGNAPQRKMGDSPANPGSGMRRSKEGALYNLAQRTEILSHAVDLDLIHPTNDRGLDAEEYQYRFKITDRGRWYLRQFYGDHTPVAQIKRVKLSRVSSALNTIKKIIPADTDTSIKSYEEWQEQVDNIDPLDEPETGHYHINPEIRTTAPETDPQNKALNTWIHQKDIPEQFDVTLVDGQTHLTVNLDEYCSASSHTWNLVKFTLDEETGDLTISKTDTQADIHLSNTGSKIGVKGDYDPFVTSGAKDTLKEATDATYNSDYETWYIPIGETLAGIKAMLKCDGIDAVSAMATDVKEYTEHL